MPTTAADRAAAETVARGPRALGEDYPRDASLLARRRAVRLLIMLAFIALVLAIGSFITAHRSATALARESAASAAWMTLRKRLADMRDVAERVGLTALHVPNARDLRVEQENLDRSWADYAAAMYALRLELSRTQLAQAASIRDSVESMDASLALLSSQAAQALEAHATGDSARTGLFLAAAARLFSDFSTEYAHLRQRVDAERMTYLLRVTKQASVAGSKSSYIVAGSAVLLLLFCVLTYQLRRELLQRAHSERQLRTLASRFEALLQSLQGMAYRCDNDADWSMQYVSAGAAELTGYRVEELLDGSVPYGSLIHAEDVPLVWAAVQVAVETHQPFRVRYRIRRADGALRWVFEQGLSVPGGAPGQVALEGFIEDVTEQVESEARIRTERQFAQRLFDNLAVPAFVLDRDHRVMLWNKACAKLTGVDAETIVGTGDHAQSLYGVTRATLADCIIDGSSADLDSLYETVSVPNVEGGLSAENWCDLVSGRRAYLLFDAGAVRDEAGNIVAAVETLRDATVRKQMEHDLVAARDEALSAARIKAEFLANMSHEIRTPMHGVLGILDLLADTGVTAEQQDLLDTANRSAHALLDIIDGVLDLSKIEAGRLELEQVETDVAGVVEDVCGLLAPRACGRALELLVFVAEDVPAVVETDRTRLRQILTNLIGNALKFTEQGQVSVRATLAERSGAGAVLRFDIEDTGIGIPEAALARLFTPFSQVDGSTTRRFGGTGLGLSISRRLVALMNGQIGVQTEEGRGSCFWFTLPVALPVETAGREPEPDLRGLRALIVDDNATNRRILEGYFSSWGMTCESHESALSAIAALDRSTEGFDVAALDLHMPEMDGLDLSWQISRIERHGRTARILLSSGGHVERSRIEEAGVHCVHAKPVRRTVLRRLIADAVGRSVPAANARPAAPPASRRASYSGARVLVVEDNLVNARVAAGLLRRFGIEADFAGDGAVALARLEEQRFDIVFMDCQMPVLDGFAATAELRRRERETGRPATVVIALTANTMAEDRERCLAAGMDDYLPKPVRTEDLAAQLSRWLGGGEPPLPAALPVEQLAAAPIDAAVLESMRELMGGSLPDLVRTFLAESARLVQAMEAALDSGDRDTIARHAHALKSSSGSLGAVRVSSAARLLESMARQPGSADCAAGVALCRVEAARAAAVLQREITRDVRAPVAEATS